VSGLPRSGTSLMQRMLEAGGIEPLTDEIRTADENNPKGYYEYERVKKLKDDDTGWLNLALGKSVKIISALLEYLPEDYFYRVLFMQRNMHEILASQNKMLVDRGEPTDKVSDEQMAQLYKDHLQKVAAWLEIQNNFRVLYVDYNQLLREPIEPLAQIRQFLDKSLQVEEMAKVIDSNLYRQRKASTETDYN
jgi:hypothetical protein